jgi:hypothetical protein
MERHAQLVSIYPFKRAAPISETGGGKQEEKLLKL